jgi:methionyl-tRNA formyltransferase
VSALWEPGALRGRAPVRALARLAYLGSPSSAVPPLRALVGAGHEVALVVSRPDRRRARGAAPSPSPVKEAALELGIPVSESVEDVPGSGASLGVVVAFGKLVKPAVLSRVPMLNLHFSLLPRWRGAAPVERAILAGDRETGVCLMALEEGLDTGPLYGCRRLEIGDDETAGELVGRLLSEGTELLLEKLADPPASLGQPVPQVGEATYAAKIEPEERHLDWARPSAELHRVVRIGRAWTTFRGRRLLVHRSAARPGTPAGAPPGSLSGHLAVTGAGMLELVEVQAEGRARVPGAEWVRGVRPRPGERLGG